MSLILKTVVFVAAALSIKAQECTSGKRVRREWRTLSSDEQKHYVDVVRQLHDQGKFEQFGVKHHENWNNWHSTAYFFPAHRQFILDFENALREIDPEMIVPYWNWAMDSANPSQSPIWQQFSRVGGRCAPELGANMFQGKYCVQRFINESQPLAGDFSDEATLGELINDKQDFYAWSSTFEVGPHFNVHFFVGGEAENGSKGTMFTHYSPWDPIFWLNHAFVDKLFNDWQAKYGKDQFKGPRKPDSNAPHDAEMSDTIPGFNVRVSEVMDIEKTCVAYDQDDQGEEPVPIFTSSSSPSTTLTTSSSMPSSSIKSSIPVTSASSQKTSDSAQSTSTVSAFNAQITSTVSASKTQITSAASVSKTESYSSAMPAPSSYNNGNNGTYKNSSKVVLAPEIKEVPREALLHAGFAPEAIDKAMDAYHKAFNKSRERYEKEGKVYVPGKPEPVAADYGEPAEQNSDGYKPKPKKKCRRVAHDSYKKPESEHAAAPNSPDASMNAPQGGESGSSAPDAPPSTAPVNDYEEIDNYQDGNSTMNNTDHEGFISGANEQQVPFVMALVATIFAIA